MLELTSKEISAGFSTLGARLLSLRFAGVELLAGGGSNEECLAGDWTAGAICGRVAGRISSARFSLDGISYQLAANMGAHQLHGGPDNFAVRHWTARRTEDSLRFELHSPDGDQGYPGALDASATYTLAANVLRLDLEARVTIPTVVNLTNHAYWNLSGGSRDAFSHELLVDGAHFLPLDELLLPTGEIRAVEGTRWDFRKARMVREAYDNFWVLAGMRGTMRRALVLRDPVSGRRMEVWTTEAGVQVYTANHWSSGMAGRQGPLASHAAIAIEPQNFPNAPNCPGFPSAVLRPGETYLNRIEWRFG